MPRCKACDYCDSTGEMSPYKWGLTVANYSGQFVLDTKTNEIYCWSCWGDISSLHDEWNLLDENYFNPREFTHMGENLMERVDARNAGFNEETHSESGS